MKPSSMEAQICLRSWLRAEIVKPWDIDFSIPHSQEDEDHQRPPSPSAPSGNEEPPINDILVEAMMASDIFEEMDASTEEPMVDDFVY